MLATASFDASTAVWAERGGDWECVAVVEGHENEVKSCAWSPSGALLATCGRDKTVWIWEVQPGFDFECVAVLHGHAQDVKQVRWHPTEDVLVSVSYDDEIRVWEEDPGGDDWSCARALSAKDGGHTSTVWSAAFEASPGATGDRGDGPRMATCSDDRNIVVWAAKGAPRERWTARSASFLVFLFFFRATRDAARETPALVRRSSRARSRCARVNITASEIDSRAWQLQQAKLQPMRHLLVDVSDLRRRHRLVRACVFLFFLVTSFASLSHLFSSSSQIALKQPARRAWRSRRRPRSRAATTARCWLSPGVPRGSSRREAATTACGATAPAAGARGGKSAPRRGHTPTT